MVHFHENIPKPLWFAVAVIAVEVATRFHVRIEGTANADVAVNARHRQGFLAPFIFANLLAVVAADINLFSNRTIAPILNLAHLFHKVLANGNLGSIARRMTHSERNIKHVEVAFGGRKAVGKIE